MADSLTARLRAASNPMVEAMGDGERLALLVRLANEAATVLDALRGRVDTLTADNVKLRAFVDASLAEVKETMVPEGKP